MSRLPLFAVVLAVVSIFCGRADAASQAMLLARDAGFELRTADGRTFGSEALIGAVLEAPLEDGGVARFRIEDVQPSDPQAAEKPVRFHSFVLLDARGLSAGPLCDPDAYGRRVAFPIAGRWDERGRFVKDPKALFIACTSGAQGKCLMWGYDPWRRGPHGEDLAPYYEACTHLVRADYAGGAAHTRNGTLIEVWDDLGVQTQEPKPDPSLRFEAGWGPAGAVCVAKTRYADLLPLDVLLQSQPNLAGPCDEAVARGRGALIFNRSR